MKKAAIDLGTNTCLLLIVDRHASGEEVILHDESQIVRLGQGVAEHRHLQADAMERVRHCLSHYAKVLKEFEIPPREVTAVGTAQARMAENAAKFFDEIESEFQIRFQILSGEEEALATFRGAALPGIPSDECVVLDIGGGSTELVAASTPGQALNGQSLEMGAVRLSEKYFHSDPVSDAEFWACESAIDEMLLPLIEWRGKLKAGSSSSLKLVAVAGTAVTLAMVQNAVTQFDRTQIDGQVLTQGDAHRLVEEFKWRTQAERKLMPGMEPKRADVILAGALIFWRVMEVLQFKTVTISTRGLRYGVIQ